MFKELLIGAALVFFTTSLKAQSNGFIVKLNGDTIKGEIRMTVKPGYSKPAKYKLKNAANDKIKFKGDEVSFMKIGNNEYCLMELFPEKKKEDKGLFGIVKSECGNLILRRSYEKITGNGTFGTGAASNGTYGTSSSGEIYYHIYEEDKFVAELKKKNYKELIPKYFSCDEKWIREIKHNKRLKFNKLFKGFEEEEEKYFKGPFFGF